MSKRRFGYIFLIRNRCSSGVQEGFETLYLVQLRQAAADEAAPAAEPPSDKERAPKMDYAAADMAARPLRRNSSAS